MSTYTDLSPRQMLPLLCLLPIRLFAVPQMTPLSELFPSLLPSHPVAPSPPIPERLPTVRVDPTLYTRYLHLCVRFSASCFKLFSYLCRLTLGQHDYLVELLKFLAGVFFHPVHNVI